LVGSIGPDNSNSECLLQKWVEIMSTEHLPIAIVAHKDLEWRRRSNMTDAKGHAKAETVFQRPDLESLVKAFLPQSKIQGQKEVLKGELFVKDFRVMEHRPERVTRTTKIQIQV
jgi:hypothetical protein